MNLFVIIKKVRTNFQKCSDIFSVTLANKSCLVYIQMKIVILSERHSPNFKTAWNRELFWTDLIR